MLKKILKYLVIIVIGFAIVGGLIAQYSIPNNNSNGGSASFPTVEGNTVMCNPTGSVTSPIACSASQVNALLNTITTNTFVAQILQSQLIAPIFNNFGFSPEAWAAGTNMGAYSSSATYVAPTITGCNVVSFSGTNYISMSNTSNTVTPGTDTTAWFPLPSSAVNPTPNNTDCLGYTLIALGQANNSVPMMALGRASYTSNLGFNTGTSGSFGLSITGVGQANSDGQEGTELKAGTTMTDLYIHGTSNGTNTSLLGWVQVTNLTLNANSLAQHALTMAQVKQANTDHLTMRGCTGFDYCYQSGSSAGDGSFQVTKQDHTVLGTGNPKSSWLTATATGTSPTVTVTASGTYAASSQPPVLLMGTGTSGTSDKPCTTMPTSWTYTETGSGPWNITNIQPVGGSGCGGTMYILVPDIGHAAYGEKWYDTDGVENNIVINQAAFTGIYNSHPNTQASQIHPIGMPILIEDAGSAHWHQVEFDSPYQFIAQIDSGRTNPATFSDSYVFYNNTYPGSSGFNTQSGATVTLSNWSCANLQSSGNYNTVMNDTTGPLQYPLNGYGYQDCGSGTNFPLSLLSGSYVFTSTQLTSTKPISSATVTSSGNFNVAGILQGITNKPTITNTVGTMAVNTGSTNIAGTLTSSTTGTVTFTLNWVNASYVHRGVCRFTDETTSVDVNSVNTTQATPATTAGLTATGTVVTGDIISYGCGGY